MVEKQAMVRCILRTEPTPQQEKPSTSKASSSHYLLAALLTVNKIEYF